MIVNHLEHGEVGVALTEEGIAHLAETSEDHMMADLAALALRQGYLVLNSKDTGTFIRVGTRGEEILDMDFTDDTRFPLLAEADASLAPAAVFTPAAFKWEQLLMKFPNTKFYVLIPEPETSETID